MSVRKGFPLTIVFAPVDSSNRPVRKTGVAFDSSDGDVQISQDGGNFVVATNDPVEKDNAAAADSGRYALALTAAEMNADWIQIFIQKTGVDPIDIQIATDAHPDGSVVDDAANTATTFKTDLAESSSDYWKDSFLLFTTGALVGQVKKVSAYNGTTKFVTLAAALTAEPAAGDDFVLINS